MATFKMIHIFGTQDVQLINDNVNYIAKAVDLSALDAVVADVKAQKPEDLVESNEYTIDIAEQGIVKYRSGEKNSTFTTNLSKLSSTTLDALVAELTAAYEASIS